MLGTILVATLWNPYYFLLEREIFAFRCCLGTETNFLQGLWFCSTAYPLWIISAVSPDVWSQSLMPSQMWFFNTFDSKLSPRITATLGYIWYFLQLSLWKDHPTWIFEGWTAPLWDNSMTPRLHCPVSLYEKQLTLGRSSDFFRFFQRLGSFMRKTPKVFVADHCHTPELNGESSWERPKDLGLDCHSLKPFHSHRLLEKGASWGVLNWEKTKSRSMSNWMLGTTGSFSFWDSFVGADPAFEARSFSTICLHQ